MSSFFYFFHYILNDLVILAIVLVIDIRLILVVKRSLSQKIQVRISFQNLDSVATNTSASSKRLKEEYDNKKSIENKANAMIVANMVLYLICRVPEMAATFFYYFHLFRSSSGVLIACLNTSFCYQLANTIEFFYILSYLFDILI